MSSHVITKWEPEDKAFWEKEGKGVATRNLWISIPALLLAFFRMDGLEHGGGEPA